MLAEIGATSQDISASGVRIWKAHLDGLSAPDIDELSGSLDSAEHARAARFHFERDRRHYIASRGLLRRLLGATLEKPPSEIIFEYGVHGKPAIAAREKNRNLHFNLSHSSGWAMFAVVWDREVGIDLECGARLERDGESFSKLAARILSPHEFALWRALPDDAQRRAAFLRAWTRKEAYVKATGHGVFDGLDRIEVMLDAAAPKPSVTLRSTGAAEPARDWIIYDLPGPEGFAAALAVEHETKPNP